MTSYCFSSYCSVPSVIQYDTETPMQLSVELNYDFVHSTSLMASV
jgi:hypothetical protein